MITLLCSCLSRKNLVAGHSNGMPESTYATHIPYKLTEIALHVHVPGPLSPAAIKNLYTPLGFSSIQALLYMAAVQVASLLVAWPEISTASFVLLRLLKF